MAFSWPGANVSSLSAPLKTTTLPVGSTTPGLAHRPWFNGPVSREVTLPARSTVTFSLSGLATSVSGEGPTTPPAISRVERRYGGRIRSITSAGTERVVERGGLGSHCLVLRL